MRQSSHMELGQYSSQENELEDRDSQTGVRIRSHQSLDCANVRLSLSASIPFLLNLSFILSLEMHSVQLKSTASLEEMGL